jgi:hypothetical protein
MTRPLRIVIVAAALASGCTIHLERNAPGHANIAEPPRDLAKRAVETPADPGETVLMLNAGGFIGGGTRFLQAHSDGFDGFAELGFEAGAHWECRDKSHEKPDLFPFLPHAIPLQTHGVNVGGAFTGDETLRLSELYAEYSRRDELWGWAIGWSLDPGELTHGPHGQIFWYYGYARGSWQIDRGGEVTVGFFFKLPEIITWSR